jgi:hypothetical protein
MVRTVGVWIFSLLLFPGLAYGGSSALLSDERQTVMVVAVPGGVPMIAFYELAKEHANVTMLIQDDDDVLRTRVQLLDGQHHVIFVEEDTRFLLHRTGDVVQVRAEHPVEAF